MEGMGIGKGDSFGLKQRDVPMRKEPSKLISATTGVSQPCARGNVTLEGKKAAGIVSWVRPIKDMVAPPGGSKEKKIDAEVEMIPSDMASFMKTVLATHFDSSSPFGGQSTSLLTDFCISQMVPHLYCMGCVCGTGVVNTTDLSEIEPEIRMAIEAQIVTDVVRRRHDRLLQMYRLPSSSQLNGLCIDVMLPYHTMGPVGMFDCVAAVTSHVGEGFMEHICDLHGSPMPINQTLLKDAESIGENTFCVEMPVCFDPTLHLDLDRELFISVVDSIVAKMSEGKNVMIYGGQGLLRGAVMSICVLLRICQNQGHEISQELTELVSSYVQLKRPGIMNFYDSIESTPSENGSTITYTGNRKPLANFGVGIELVELSEQELGPDSIVRSNHELRRRCVEILKKHPPISG